MRTLHAALYLFVSFFLVLFLGGCTKDDELIDKGSEIPVEQLPDNVIGYMSELFPGDKPLKAEKIAGEENAADFLYQVMYEDSVTLVFDKEGVWQKTETPTGKLPQNVESRYEDIIKYVEQHYSNNMIVCFTKAEYGTTVTLEDQKMLAFDKKFLGYELGVNNIESSLPYQIRTFVSTYFGDVAYTQIVRNEEKEMFCSVWLKNKVKIIFNTNSEWEIIDGNGQLLPEALIKSLPKVVQEFLADYPDAQTTYMEIEKKATHIIYSFRISDSLTVSLIIDNPDRPLIDPHDAISNFIITYFDVSSYSIYIPMKGEDPVWKIALSDGFDFTMNEAGNWKTVNGHGYPFSEKLLKLVPEAITSYITSNFKTEITAIQNNTDTYLLTFTTGKSVKFNKTGEFLGEETYTLTGLEKAYTYFRYHYPKVTSPQKIYTGEFWVFTLEDGTEIKFDKDGNLV